MKVFIAAWRRPRALEFLLKSPGLSRLKEVRVQQGDTHVAQHDEASYDKEVPAPTDRRTIARRKSPPPHSHHLHGVSLG